MQQLESPSESAPRRRRRRWTLLLLAAWPAAIALQLLAASAPATVESVYAGWVYPHIAELLGRATGWFRYSLAELLLVACALLVAWRSLRAATAVARRRASPLGVLRRGLCTALAAGGVLYSVFLCVWGLNYQRPPLAELCALDVEAPEACELRALCEELVAETNALRAEVSVDADGVMRPESELMRTLERGFQPM